MAPWLIVLISALLFGAATPISKVLLSRLEPVELAAWLYLGAALGVLPAIWRSGRFGSVRRMSRANLLRLLGAIVCGGILGPVALLCGLRLAAAGSVSLWLNLELVATAVLGHAFFRDHLGRVGWLGAGGVVGAGMLLSAGAGAAGIAAIAWVALACTLWGLDNQLTARIDDITPAQSTFWKGLVAGGFNLVLATLLGGPPSSAGPAAGALLVGTLAYGASIALYITGAQQLGATRAQLAFASAPFFGVGWSRALLSEPIGMRTLAASALFLVSLVLVLRDRHGHAHTHEELEHEHAHRHDDGHHRHDHPGLPERHGHSHRHRHARTSHRHPHWHDLHHKHPHP